MATTEGSLRSASGFKRADPLVIDAKYDLALVGDVYAEFSFFVFKFVVLTGLLWPVFCPFFRGFFRVPVVCFVRRYLLTDIV